jgi:hypothetical protein
MRSEELVGRAHEDVGAQSVRFSRRCCARCTTSTATTASTSFASVTRSAAGGIVPTALEASVNATSFVRGDRVASNKPTSIVTSSSRTSTHRMVAPASVAASTHGRTFAS